MIKCCDEPNGPKDYEDTFYCVEGVVLLIDIPRGCIRHVNIILARVNCVIILDIEIHEARPIPAADFTPRFALRETVACVDGAVPACDGEFGVPEFWCREAGVGGEAVCCGEQEDVEGKEEAEEGREGEVLELDLSG